jgi:hypothetical protein
MVRRQTESTDGGGDHVQHLNPHLDPRLLAADRRRSCTTAPTCIAARMVTTTATATATSVAAAAAAAASVGVNSFCAGGETGEQTSSTSGRAEERVGQSGVACPVRHPAAARSRTHRSWPVGVGGGWVPLEHHRDDKVKSPIHERAVGRRWDIKASQCNRPASTN